MDTKLTGIPAEWVERVWPAIEPFVQRWLDKAKEHRWNTNDIKDAISERNMQLWAAEKDGHISTIVLTEILNYPRVRECNVFMVSGEMTVRDDWREVVDEVVEWAATQGCHYISSMARKGSEKVMGWGVRQTYIVRAI